MKHSHINILLLSLLFCVYQYDDDNGNSDGDAEGNDNGDDFDEFDVTHTDKHIDRLPPFSITFFSLISELILASEWHRITARIIIPRPSTMYVRTVLSSPAWFSRVPISVAVWRAI